jgi:lysyl-tRNA synthetase class 2
MRSVGYGDKDRSLYVTFPSEDLYRYFEVPPAIYAELLSAGSKGEYFNARIKNFFPFERLRERKNH